VALLRVQEELAQVTRVMSMGELTASIAHEVSQPLAAMVVDGNAGLRWLAHDTPNLAEARACLGRIVGDGKRAGEVISRIRTFLTAAAPNKTLLDINEVIQETLTLTHGEIMSQRIIARVDLWGGLQPICGDRVQLQQVILNLVMNSIEAMRPVTERPRELLVRSCSDKPDEVLVSVQDSGIGFDRRSLDRLFDAFFTTKPHGMGLGLVISRRIVEAHGGRLWSVSNNDHGVTLSFTLPVAAEKAHG
jgi:signal transduction histidine kinase